MVLPFQGGVSALAQGRPTGGVARSLPFSGTLAQEPEEEQVAARIVLPREVGLEPGPVAVFSQGTFAGEGLPDLDPFSPA